MPKKKNGKLKKKKAEKPSLEIAQNDSFILFREDGEFLMHVGPDNENMINRGGYMASFCTWAMGKEEWHQEFGSFLEKLSESNVVDTAVEAGVSLATAEKS